MSVSSNSRLAAPRESFSLLFKLLNVDLNLYCLGNGEWSEHCPKNLCFGKPVAANYSNPSTPGLSKRKPKVFFFFCSTLKSCSWYYLFWSLEGLEGHIVEYKLFSMGHGITLGCLRCVCVWGGGTHDEETGWRDCLKDKAAEMTRRCQACLFAGRYFMFCLCKLLLLNWARAWQSWAHFCSLCRW